MNETPNTRIAEHFDTVVAAYETKLNVRLRPEGVDRERGRMMLKLNHLSLCVVALLPMAAIAQAPMPSVARTETVEHHSEVAAIEHVMKQFHDAVVGHDGAALSALFLPDANIWLNVLTDAAYDRAQAAAKTPKVRVSSYRDFAKFVSTTSKGLDAEHSNIVIHTDGTIAAVYFDFVFKIDGKDENHGSETWQLVKTVDGWRIAAILYSSDPAAQKQ
jgi:ketosteroid isomerase-like protein